MAIPDRYLRAIRRYGPGVDKVASRYTNPVTGKPLSGTALLAKLGKGESGFRQEAVGPSTKYGRARGSFQFIPGTRQAVRKHTGGKVDPWRSPEEAVKSAAIHLRGELGHKKGLEGYNPGHPISYYLNQKVGNVKGGRGKTAGGSRTTTSTKETVVRPGVSREQERKQARLAFVKERKKPGAIQELVSNLGQLQDIAPITKTTTTTKKTSNIPDVPKGKPKGGYAGTEGLIIPYSQYAHSLGVGTSSGKRDRVRTASGNVSDHAKIKKKATARDWSGPTPAMDKLARKIARDLGVKNYKGGNLVRTKDGFRYQLLYRTNIGGNHFDHVHLGIERQ